TMTPMITFAPGDMEFECYSEVPPLSIDDFDVADNCAKFPATGSFPLLTKEVTQDSVGFGSANDPMILTRCYIAFDQCQRDTLCQVITIIDDEAPVPNMDPADIQVVCVVDTMAAPVITAMDNCSDPVSMTYMVSSNGGTGCIGDTLRFIRTWTFTDDVGNDTSVVQVIDVVDNVAPVYTGPLDSIFVECPGVIPVPSDLTVNDNPGTGCEVVIAATV